MQIGTDSLKTIKLTREVENNRKTSLLLVMYLYDQDARTGYVG